MWRKRGKAFSSFLRCSSHHGGEGKPTEESLSYGSRGRRLPAHILEDGKAEQKEFPNKLVPSFPPWHKLGVPTCVLVPSTCRVALSSPVNSPGRPHRQTQRCDSLIALKLVMKTRPQNVRYSDALSVSLTLTWFVVPQTHQVPPKAASDLNCMIPPL